MKFALAMYDQATGEKTGFEQQDGKTLTFETREAAQLWLDMYAQFIRIDYKVEVYCD